MEEDAPDAMALNALKHQPIEDRLHQLHILVRVAGRTRAHILVSHDSLISKTLTSRSHFQQTACCSSQRIFRQPDIKAPNGLLTRAVYPQLQRMVICQSVADML
jgi:hypothetical protein